MCCLPRRELCSTALQWQNLMYDTFAIVGEACSIVMVAKVCLALISITFWLRFESLRLANLSQVTLCLVRIQFLECPSVAWRWSILRIFHSLSSFARVRWELEVPSWGLMVALNWRLWRFGVHGWFVLVKTRSWGVWVTLACGLVTSALG